MPITTSTWTATAGGDFATGADWTPTGMPQGTGSAALIGAAGLYTVTLSSGDATVTLDAVTLNQSGVTFSLGGTLQLGRPDALFDLAAGTLLFNGGELLGGTLDQAGGTLSFTGSAGNQLDNVTIIGNLGIGSGGVVLAGSTTIYTDASKTTLGTVQVGGGLVAIRNGASFTVAQDVALAGGELTFGAPSTTVDVTLGASAVVSGYGNISDGYGGFSGVASLTNQGTILANIANTTLYVTPVTFANAGLMQAAGGILWIEQNLNRAWTNEATGTISVSAGGSADLAGPFANAGRIIVTGATLGLDGTYSYGTLTTWTNTGTISATNSTIYLAGNETVAQIGRLVHDSSDKLIYTKGVLDNTGGTLGLATTALTGVTLNGATIEGGAVDHAGLGLTFAYNGNNQLDSVDVIGGLTLNGGGVVLAGGSTVYADASKTALGTLNIGNGALAIRSTSAITLDQVALLAGGVLTFDNPGTTADVTIGTSGVVSGYGYLTDGLYSFSGADSVLNKGTIVANVAGQQIIVAPTVFENAGVMQAAGGSLAIEYNVNRAWTNDATGTISVSAGGSAELGGPFSNAGLITSSGGTLVLDGTYNYGTPTTWTNTGTISATNSTIYIAGNETVGQIGTLVHDHTDTFIYYKGVLDNTGGTLDATTTALIGVTLNGATIEGGVLDQTELGLTFAYNGNNQLDSVDVIGGLTLNGGGVVLAGGSTVYADASQTTLGTLSIGNGVLAIRSTSAITLDQTALLAGGYLTFDNPGTTADVTIGTSGVVSGYGYLTDGVYGFSGADSVLNKGTILANVAGQPIVVAPTVFENAGVMQAAGGSLAIEYNVNRAWTNDATGTISISANGSAELSGPFINAGLITSTGGTIALDGTYNYGTTAVTWINTGTISANNSTIYIAGNETVGQIGTLIHDSTDVLMFSAGTLENTGGSLNAATNAFIGVTLNGATIEGGVLDQAGLGLSFANNSRNVLDNVALINGFTLAGGQVILSGTSAAYANGSLTKPGTLRVTSGGVLGFRGAGPFTLTESAVLANGTLTWIGTGGAAQVTVDASASIVGTGLIADNYYNTNTPDTLTNQGSIVANVSNQTLSLSTTGFVNNGVLKATNYGVLQVERNTNNAWTNAAGGLIQGEVGSTIWLGGPFTNAGTINVQGGTLVLDGTGSGATLTSWSNTGVINALDETILINGNETVGQIGSIDGIASQIIYQSGTLNNAGNTLDGSSTSLLNMELNGATVFGGTIDAHALGLRFGTTWSTLNSVSLIDSFANVSGNVVLTGSSAVYADASASTPA